MHVSSVSTHLLAGQGPCFPSHTHQPFTDFKGSLLHKGGDPPGWSGHTLPLISKHFSELGRQEVLLWPFKNKGIGHKG